MDKFNGAEAAVRMLDLYGVRHIFGLCGDTSLPFYDALYRMEHRIAHVLTRDERSAAYMADGYARVSGRPGVCEGPSGGGATYLLPGLVEANESSSPVLGITSDVPVLSRGRYPLTELDQEALLPPAHQVEHGVRPGRSGAAGHPHRVPLHDHRPSGCGAHRPALRRPEASRRSGGDLGRRTGTIGIRPGATAPTRPPCWRRPTPSCRRAGPCSSAAAA